MDCEAPHLPEAKPQTLQRSHEQANQIRLGHRQSPPGLCLHSFVLATETDPVDGLFPAPAASMPSENCRLPTHERHSDFPDHRLKPGIVV